MLKKFLISLVFAFMFCASAAYANPELAAEQLALYDGDGGVVLELGKDITLLRAEASVKNEAPSEQRVIICRRHMTLNLNIRSCFICTEPENADRRVPQQRITMWERKFFHA